MAFAIVIQRNNSDKNVFDKNITNITSITGELKAACSIIDPVFIVQGDLSTFVGCNYVTINEFGRSYFVNNITSVNKDYVELACHVDVLTSFRSQIRSNNAIVHRQQHAWNLYLNDGALRVYQNPDVTVKTFPSGFKKQEFVLAVAGS